MGVRKVSGGIPEYGLPRMTLSLGLWVAFHPEAAQRRHHESPKRRAQMQKRALREREVAIEIHRDISGTIYKGKFSEGSLAGITTPLYAAIRLNTLR
jgi:hypothetical protein